MYSLGLMIVVVLFYSLKSMLSLNFAFYSLKCLISLFAIYSLRCTIPNACILFNKMYDIDI